MSATLPTSAASPASSTRPHLDYLDGLRGLAALYVVLHHGYDFLPYVIGRYEGRELPNVLLHATNWLFYGQVAVDVFIVLSGYCLMIPVAKSADGQLRGGTLAFLKRRARRILTPYYAALVLALVIIAVVPGMSRMSGRRFDEALPAFTPAVLLSHLFLIHNLSVDWMRKIDLPMWSVATEWQIYFLFPILLIIWRRSGPWITSLAALALGFILHFAWHSRIDAACPQFIGLFAFGMAAASVGFSTRPDMLRVKAALPWGAITLALTVFFWFASTFKSSFLWAHVSSMDVLVGAATACLLVFCTRHLTDASASPKPAVLRLLESRPCVVLGTFSYSLYLVHFLVLVLLDLALKSLRLDTITTLWVMLSIGTLLSLGVSYLFHLAFERPFMGTPPPRTERQAEVAAITSPAP